MRLYQTYLRWRGSVRAILKKFFKKKWCIINFKNFQIRYLINVQVCHYHKHVLGTHDIKYNLYQKPFREG